MHVYVVGVGVHRTEYKALLDSSCCYDIGLQNYDFGAPFLAQNPQSVKILTSSFFEVEPSN